MERTFGRVSIDDRGIRKSRFLLFFGRPFDLTWDSITGWDTVEAVLASGDSTWVISRMLELQTADKLHYVDWSGPTAEFNALLEEVRRRLPDKRTDSILKKMNPGMYR
jgi:hypothetical protein